MKVSFTLDGAARTVEVAPGERLLDTLRGLRAFSVKRGCEAGSCGACTVLVEGEARLSCLLFSAAMEGAHIQSVAGVPDDLGRALVEVGGVQCGFCTPGMVLSAHALLEKQPDPDEAAIRRALDGNLCRCTGYNKIVEGVRLAATRRRAGGAA